MIWSLPHIVAGTMVLAVTAYMLLAGADFGGGVWDLLASGKRRDAQRTLIANAIGPVWEANHVWLILVVVMLFSCFPAAFAHISTELHVPLTLMLVGIVLRGSAFTFRSYDKRNAEMQNSWGLIFSIASIVTPVLLGMCLGTVAAGNIPMHDASLTMSFAERFVAPWCSAFALSVGTLTLALCAMLAATYLTVEAKEAAVRNDFRRRALIAAGVVSLLAAVTIFLARRDAPLVFTALSSGTRAVFLLGITTTFATAAAVLLWKGAFVLARIAVAGQVSLIVWGWAWSQYPYLIPPTRTIASLAAPRATLLWVMGVLIAGTLVLLPSFLYLFRIFKSEDRFIMRDDAAHFLDKAAPAEKERQS